MPPKKTPPCEHYPEWTESRYWSFIRSALRRVHIKWPPAQNCMRNGRRAVVGKRHKWEHKCEECKQWTPQPKIEKDHRVPVGSLKCYEDLPGFVERLFVSEDGYRKICISCHQRITNEERKNKK